jgi:hypothetical protein
MSVFFSMVFAYLQAASAIEPISYMPELPHRFDGSEKPLHGVNCQFSDEMVERTRCHCDNSSALIVIPREGNSSIFK